MFGLFSLGKIEDYYDVSRLVAVSDDRAKLQKYIDDKIADFELYKLLHEKYYDIRKTMPKFEEPPPTRHRLGFAPKTRDEHKQAERFAREYEAAYRAHRDRNQEFEKTQDEQAYVLFCRKEELWQDDVKKSRVMYRYSFEELPEYEIREVEVW